MWSRSKILRSQCCILTDTKHRAASLRQLSFLFRLMTNDDIFHCCVICLWWQQSGTRADDEDHVLVRSPVGRTRGGQRASGTPADTSRRSTTSHHDRRRRWGSAAAAGRDSTGPSMTSESLRPCDAVWRGAAKSPTADESPLLQLRMRTRPHPASRRDLTCTLQQVSAGSGSKDVGPGEGTLQGRHTRGKIKMFEKLAFT